jgi:tetratricopeptide (TPR) repeat protein
LGRFDLAERYIQQSRALAQAISFQRGEGWNLLCLSLLEQQRGNDARALSLAEQGAAIFTQLGDRLGDAHSATNLGRSLAGLGRLDEAKGQLERALRLREELRQTHLKAELHAWLAHIAHRQGDAKNTEAHLHQVLDYLTSGSLDGMEEPIRVCQFCAELLGARGDERADELAAQGRALQKRRTTLSCG